ncbi:MAG: hypothetical protein ACHP65_00980 [Legionellales bacterium]
MKTKTVENFCYEGLGFPIELSQVEMIEINDEWHPKIDVKKVTNAVINVLAYQEGRLTGNQVKFIRNYFSMTLRDFGVEVAHETHAAVNKWEKHGNQVTSMNNNTECIIRLYILEQLRSETKALGDDFFSNYQKVKEFFKSKKGAPDHIHLKNCA